MDELDTRTPIQDNIDANGGEYVGDGVFRVPRSPKGRWAVNSKGGPNKAPWEITVLRIDFTHGFDSFGWYGKDKQFIGGSGGPCKDTVSQTVWDGLLRIAHEEMQRLNRAEGRYD